MWKTFGQKHPLWSPIQAHLFPCLPATHPPPAGTTFCLKLHSSEQLMAFRMLSLQTRCTSTSLPCPAEKLHILDSAESLPNPQCRSGYLRCPGHAWCHPVQVRGAAQDMSGVTQCRSGSLRCPGHTQPHLTHKCSLQEHNAPHCSSHLRIKAAWGTHRTQQDRH